MKTFAVEVGGLRVPMQFSFRGAPAHGEFFVMFSEKKRNLTRQRCALYLHNANSFSWPPKMNENKRVSDIVRAPMGTVYYLQLESSHDCTLHLSLQQKESDAINQNWVSN